MENKAKPAMAASKRGAVVAKPGLRPRTALGDIGNKACDPKPKEVVKKVILCAF